MSPREHILDARQVAADDYLQAQELTDAGWVDAPPAWVTQTFKCAPITVAGPRIESIYYEELSA